MIQRPVLDCMSGRASKLIGGVAPGILRPRAYEPEMLKERSSAPGTRAESIPDASPRAARTCAISRRHTEIFEGEECVFSGSFRERESGSVVIELAERIAPDARNAARGSSAVAATCRAVSSGLSEFIDWRMRPPGALSRAFRAVLARSSAVSMRATACLQSAATGHVHRALKRLESASEPGKKRISTS